MRSSVGPSMAMSAAAVFCEVTHLISHEYWSVEMSWSADHEVPLVDTQSLLGSPT